MHHATRLTSSTIDRDLDPRKAKKAAVKISAWIRAAAIYFATDLPAN